MALNPRENINGVTPQDLNKINNNFMNVWKTLFGGLDFSDTNNKLKKKIQTQQIPVQGEGNFDKNFPLYIRFFVPSNTKEVTNTSFNMICERYRMDSSVAMDGGGVAGGKINLSLATATGASSSVSAGSYSKTVTTPVKKWYKYDISGYRDEEDPPQRPMWVSMSGNGTASLSGTDYVTGVSHEGYPLVGVVKRFCETNYGQVDYVDLCYFNHEHDVSVSIPPHSHTITVQPHTHSGTASIDLPDHKHDLNEGIKISSKDAQNVNLKINGVSFATMDSISGNIKNNIDIKDNIKIGEWNIIECTTSNLARITIYGIIELVMNY